MRCYFHLLYLCSLMKSVICLFSSGIVGLAGLVARIWSRWSAIVKAADGTAVAEQMESLLLLTFTW